MTDLPDLFDDVQAAKVAALLLDRVGEAAVRQYRSQVRYPVPKPGTAVLACRCGAMLNAGQMRRRKRGRILQEGEAAAVERIVCADCARADHPIGGPAWRQRDDHIEAVLRLLATADGGDT